MSVQGMDIEQVRVMASQLIRMADDVEETTQRAAMVIQNVVGSGWQGADAERFRSDFASSVRPALVRAIDELRDMTERARRELVQQEAASQA